MIAILDIDGTLVDTNYHHAIAWYRAFREVEIALALWRIHRHIGMGGDQMVESLTNAETERRHGDAIRAAEAEQYRQLIGEVQTMHGSRELLQELKQRGHTVVLASSAKREEVDRYLDLLKARDLADAWTTAKRAGIPSLAVRTGGFGADELREAGASDVFESVDELRRALSRTPLG